MREIPLTRGYAALVDDEDYERMISVGAWHVTPARKNLVLYAQHTVSKLPDGSRPTIQMHNFVMEELGIDHIDGNGLNNQKANLRVATNQQNAMNRKSRGGSSAFKGVCWSKARKRWIVQIRVDGKVRTISQSIKDEVQAAHIYDDAARLYYGEFGRYNFPVGNEQGAL